MSLVRVDSFEQISSDPYLAAELEARDAIDAFVGFLVEEDLPGAIMGETLQATLVEQFVRLRDGDRFWCEHDLEGHDKALVQSKRLSDIILRNTAVDHIQNQVFFVKK